MRWVLLACVLGLAAGSAVAEPAAAPRAVARAGDPVAGLGQPLSALERVIAHPSLALAALPGGDVLARDAEAPPSELAAWRRLRDFLLLGGGILSLALLTLTLRFRTPQDEIDRVRAALTGEGRTVDAIRRRGGLTCRTAGGAFRTYDVVLRGADGDEQTLLVGVQARWFRAGALAEFDRQGRFLRLAHPASPTQDPIRARPAAAPPRRRIAA